MPRPVAGGSGVTSQEIEMGKGDRKTAKGKRYIASHGNARPKSTATSKATGAVKAPVAKKAAVAKAPAKKAVAKKAVAKKTV
jgi:30S ribosomal protein S31